jgi:LPXTG-motif cell wall-anchored protein
VVTEPPFSLPDLLVTSDNPLGAAAPLRSTRPILTVLAQEKVGTDLLPHVFAPFPVAGLASYTDEWSSAAARPAPPQPQGVTINALQGTPVIASANGSVHVIPGDGATGKVVELTTVDATQYRYGQLDQFANALTDGQFVLQGDLIGTVGWGGSGAMHPGLLFEVRPYAGPPVNPVPMLDRWVSQALGRAQSFAHTRGALPNSPEVNTGSNPTTGARPRSSSPLPETNSGLGILPVMAATSVGLWYWLGRRRRRSRVAADEPVELPVATSSELADDSDGGGRANTGGTR